MSMAMVHVAVRSSEDSTICPSPVTSRARSPAMIAPKNARLVV